MKNFKMLIMSFSSYFTLYALSNKNLSKLQAMHAPGKFWNVQRTRNCRLTTICCDTIMATFCRTMWCSFSPFPSRHGLSENAGTSKAGRDPLRNSPARAAFPLPNAGGDLLREDTGKASPASEIEKKRETLKREQLCHQLQPSLNLRKKMKQKRLNSRNGSKVKHLIARVFREQLRSGQEKSMTSVSTYLAHAGCRNVRVWKAPARAPTVAPSRVEPSPEHWFQAPLERKASLSSPRQHSNTRACAMNGTLMTDRRWSAPPFFTLACALWTWPFSPCFATRGTLEQGNAKSSARLLCPPERRHEFPGLGHRLCAAHCAGAETWRQHLRARRPLRLPRSHQRTGAAAGRIQLRTATGHLVGGSRSCWGCAHQTVRRCLQVTCQLRLNGDKVDPSLLAMFDSQIRSAISASFTRDLPDHSWWQATTGVLFGGLGFCTAQSVALPAFIASKLVSRPSRAIPRRSQVWMVGVEDRDEVVGHCERRQSELCRQGGEQADPFMPYLFSLRFTTHHKKWRVCWIHGLCTRVRDAYDFLGLHSVKTRVWNRASVCPARVETRSMKPDGHQSVGDSSGVGGIRAGNRSQKVQAWSAVVGRHPICLRFARCKADTLAVRRLEVPVETDFLPIRFWPSLFNPLRPNRLWPNRLWQQLKKDVCR